MNTLILELPDEQLRALYRVAQKRGSSIGEVVADLVDDLVSREVDEDYDVTQDPIYNIEAHETDSPTDLSLNHDHYLYGALKR